MYKLFLYFFIVFATGCDFSSRLHKEILEAQSFISTQQYVKAAKKYQEILRLNPLGSVQVKIYYQLGELHSLHLGKNEESLKYYERIIELSENPLWLIKAEERIADIKFNFVKDYRGAIKSYNKLYRYIPTLGKQDFYHYRLGLSYLKDGQLKKAIKVFKVIAQNENHKYHVRSFFQLGLSNFYKKKWKNTIKYWTDYLRREKRKNNLVQTKFLLANAYETSEQLEKAYDAYYSILGEYPNTEVIKNRLKSLYKRRIARRR